MIACAIGILAIALTRRFTLKNSQSTNTDQGVIGPLFTFALIGITAVSITLTLPIGEAARGQLLGLLGLLVTAAIALSSTTFLGNAMAGIMLRAIRSFRPGDFISCGAHMGRVSEQGILHTEIQLEDRNLTTLPNVYLVTNPLTVYNPSGTVVSATCSLGYDVPRERVEEQLVKSAGEAGLSEPFAQIMELGDFSITYRAAGFLLDPRQLLSTRSKLRKLMLDNLHDAKIEIVSPNFVNLRTLTNSQQVIPTGPKVSKKTSTVVKPAPEERIFDKANAAEALAKMQEEVEGHKKLVQGLTTELDSSTFAEEKATLQRKLDKAKKRLEDLEALILAQSTESNT